MPVDLRGLDRIAIDRQPFVVAVPIDHPLASKRALRLKHLDGEALVMYAPTESRYHHDLASSLFRLAGISPNFVQYAREIHTMLALVGAGIGLALVPKVAGTLGFPGVKLVPITLQPPVFSELTLVWRKRADNPALRRFVEEFVPRFLEQRH
jgi:DNA-binding transcriptional LysR family regulator